MQIIAITALFAATALAAATPQWRNNDNGNNNNNWGQDGNDNWGQDGNQEGAYKHQCSCNSNRVDSWNFVQDDALGEWACNDLHQRYQNLYWQPGQGCIDANNRGVEPNGFQRACQRQAPNAQVSWNCL